MEKENTAKEGTKGAQAEQDTGKFSEKFMDCCGAMSGSGEMSEKMKGFCGGMMEKMKDCCGGKDFSYETVMKKWANCCETGDKKK